MATYTLAQVKEHNKPDDIWLVIHNTGKSSRFRSLLMCKTYMSIVYSITGHYEQHPGGIAIILDVAGQDATTGFEEAGHSVEAIEMLGPMCIGTLAEEVGFSPFSTSCHQDS
jgi:cytochrome-b5 reductase